MRNEEIEVPERKKSPSIQQAVFSHSSFLISHFLASFIRNTNEEVKVPERKKTSFLSRPYFLIPHF